MTMTTTGIIPTEQLVIGEDIPVWHRRVLTHLVNVFYSARQQAGSLPTTKSSMLYQCLMFMLEGLR
jgi:hypothetical protein